MAHQRSRINVPNNWNLVPIEVGFHRFLRPPVGSQRGKLADNQRFNVRARRLFIVNVDADISYVGVSQANNLSGITGVGENFLVSREAGIENDFATTPGLCSRGAAFEYSPVFKRECGGLSGFLGQLILPDSLLRRGRSRNRQAA